MIWVGNRGAKGPRAGRGGMGAGSGCVGYVSAKDQVQLSESNRINKVYNARKIYLKKKTGKETVYGQLRGSVVGGRGPSMTVPAKCRPHAPL